MKGMQRVARAHPALSVVVVLAVLGLGGAAWAAASMARQFAPITVDESVPEAPQLQADGPDQTVYRIDASRSTASYQVEEQLAGSSNTAVGTTSGIAGDIVVDGADPAASRVGELVINVQQLRSDESLRDNRIRREFLQSKDYPLARFRTEEVRGLPEQIDDGTDYEVTLAGQLTIKTTTNPAEVTGTVRRQDGELVIHATTTITLSDYDIGPIGIRGLVSTGNEALLTFDLVAVDVAQVTPPTVISRPEAELATGGPSFAATVQPVLEQSCASCHEPGGAGSNEWTLETAGDAAEVASGLGLVTGSRYMPPWPASDVGVPLQHSLALPDDQVAAVVAWADAGGPLDVDPATPVEAVPDEDIATPRHDVELPMPEAYQGSIDKQNDYRCFLLDPGFTEPTAITGYELLPGQVEIVHHALVYRLHGDRLDDIVATDEADPGPGWECFGGINVRGTNVSAEGSGGGSDLVMGYAPGQIPTVYADGTGLKADAGDVFVMQMHYHVTEPPEPDQTTLALQLAPDGPEGLDGVKVTTYLAPAEIPCGPDEEGPLCDRDNEMARLEEEYGGVGPMIANGLHLICGTTPQELGVLDEDLVAHSSCDHRVRNDGQLLAVLGHMHEIGLSYRMTLNPGTPEEKVLLDIPRWDFDWQFNYVPVDDIQLHRGDVIRVECSWDRHLVEAGEEPHWVSWAEGTEDEMCFSTVATRESDDPPDR